MSFIVFSDTMKVQIFLFVNIYENTKHILGFEVCFKSICFSFAYNLYNFFITTTALLIKFQNLLISSTTGNSLSLLLGDYNSDSDNDDNENTTNQLHDKLEEFLTDLNTIVTTSSY